MATNDIGVRIGLEGEADFRRQLKLITQQSKELDAEMKALVSSFNANDRSQENLTKQSQLLGKQIDTQNQKIKLLNTQYDKATTELNRLEAELKDTIQAYGEQSEEAVKAQRAYQNQSTAVSKLKTDINNATTALNKMERQQEDLTAEIKDSEDAFERASKAVSDNQDELERLKREYSNLVLEQKDATDEAQDLARQIDKLSTELSDSRSALKRAADAADELDNSLDDVDDAADDASRGMSSFADIVGGNVIADGISGIIDGINDLHESSIEYRTIMASLETSSERAGYTAQETEEAYSKLVGVLGDTQTAATTVANLQAIGYEQEDLMEAIDGVIGAWATYGDSIPIDSLAESTTETIKTATVTGTFADVLNWAGESEDDFNALLQSANSNTERANIVLKQLARQGLTEAGKGWQENNESLIEYNQAQDDLDAALADLGEAAEPLLTGLSKGLTAVLDTLNYAVDFISNTASGSLDELAARTQELTDEQYSAARAIVDSSGAIQGTTEWIDVWNSAIDEVTGKLALEEATLQRQNLETVELDQATQYYLDTMLKEIDTMDQNSQKYAEAVGAVSELTTAHQESSVAIQATIDQVNAEMDALKEQYQNVKESAKNSLDSQYSMFAELNTQVETSVATVSQNLADQQIYFENYATNLQSAIDRGVSEGLLQRLSDGSVESAAILAEMATMAGPELDAFVEQFEKTEGAKEKVAGLAADIETNFSSTMDSLEAQSAELQNQLKSENSLYYIGYDYVKGFANGVGDNLDEIDTVCVQMGELANSVSAETMGIGSPSTITHQYGVWFTQGLRNGILEGQIAAVKAAAAMAKLVSDAVKNNIRQSDVSIVGYNLAQGVRIAIINNQLAAVQQAADMANLVEAAVRNNATYSEMYSAGANVANGFAAGIRAHQYAAINAAANMAARAVSAARSRLQIHSPSKAFEELGDLSVEGFAVGFDSDEAMRQIERTMSRMLNSAAVLTQAQSNYAPIESAIRSIPSGNTDIQIVVNAAEGQSAEQIANIVMYKMQHAVNQKKAVWG